MMNAFFPFFFLKAFVLGGCKFFASKTFCLAFTKAKYDGRVLKIAM